MSDSTIVTSGYPSSEIKKLKELDPRVADGLIQQANLVAQEKLAEQKHRHERENRLLSLEENSQKAQQEERKELARYEFILARTAQISVVFLSFLAVSGGIATSLYAKESLAGFLMIGAGMGMIVSSFFRDTAQELATKAKNMFFKQQKDNKKSPS